MFRLGIRWHHQRTKTFLQIDKFCLINKGSDPIFSHMFMTGLQYMHRLAEQYSYLRCLNDMMKEMCALSEKATLGRMF